MINQRSYKEKVFLLPDALVVFKDVHGKQLSQELRVRGFDACGSAPRPFSFECVNLSGDSAKVRYSLPSGDVAETWKVLWLPTSHYPYTRLEVKRQNDDSVKILSASDINLP